MGHFTKKLAYKFYDWGEDTGKLGKSIFHFVGENYDVLRGILSGKELPAVEFMSLYDQRIYDVHSKQNDIKYMKDLDFKGIYCIKNTTKRKFYVGHADKVFKKVDRYFNGFENELIYADYKCNDYFTVQFLKLELSGYNDINEFIEDTKGNLSITLKGYSYYEKSNAKNSSSEFILHKTVGNGGINNIERWITEEEIKKKHRKARFFHHKKIVLENDSTKFIGQMYNEVSARLMENGFTNIMLVPLNDYYIDKKCRLGEVSRIEINGKELCYLGECIPYDAKILIWVHTKREIVFPYASKQLKRKDCKKVQKELLNLGYTHIFLNPINDLKFGLFVSNGSIEEININGRSKFKKDLVLEYDAKIVLSYHTFK